MSVAVGVGRSSDDDAVADRRHAGGVGDPARVLWDNVHQVPEIFSWGVGDELVVVEGEERTRCGDDTAWFNSLGICRAHVVELFPFVEHWIVNLGVAAKLPLGRGDIAANDVEIAVEDGTRALISFCVHVR